MKDQDDPIRESDTHIHLHSNEDQDESIRESDTHMHLHSNEARMKGYTPRFHIHMC